MKIIECRRVLRVYRLPFRDPAAVAGKRWAAARRRAFLERAW